MRRRRLNEDCECRKGAGAFRLLSGGFAGHLVDRILHFPFALIDFSLALQSFVPRGVANGFFYFSLSVTHCTHRRPTFVAVTRRLNFNPVASMHTRLGRPANGMRLA
jgi:hypothetical protein